MFDPNHYVRLFDVKNPEDFLRMRKATSGEWANKMVAEMKEDNAVNWKRRDHVLFAAADVLRRPSKIAQVRKAPVFTVYYIPNQGKQGDIVCFDLDTIEVYVTADGRTYAKAEDVYR